MNETYHITEADYEGLTNILANGAGGDFNIDYDTEGGEVLSIQGFLDYESYQETDFVCGYGRGTGQWVNINLNFVVQDNAVYNEDNDILPSDFDAEKLKSMIADELNIMNY